MSCWCCLRAEGSRSVVTIERIEFDQIHEQMIDEFVASVFADSVTKVSQEHGFTSESLQDEVFADDSPEITRDFSHLVGKAGSRSASVETDDGLGDEQRVTSQILDMGIFQPGLSRQSFDTYDDTNSEPDSESGVSMTGSSTAKLSNETGTGSHLERHESRSSRQKVSVLSNPFVPHSNGSSFKKMKLRRHVSWSDGGDPDTQGQSIIDIIQEDASKRRNDLIQHEPCPIPPLTSSGISTHFLDNVI